MAATRLPNRPRMCSRVSAALVLNSVMEEGGDGLVLVPTVFQDEGCNPHEVGDVRECQCRYGTDRNEAPARG